MDISCAAPEPTEKAASSNAIEELRELAQTEGADITDEQIEDLSGGVKKFPIKPR